MKIKPVGFYVLIEIEPVEETFSNSTIVMPEDQRKREIGGRDIGKVISFGKTAYLGFDGCECPEDWGVKTGDMVEFNRYDGKESRVAEIDKSLINLRYIKDSDIIGIVESGDE